MYSFFFFCKCRPGVLSCRRSVESDWRVWCSPKSAQSQSTIKVNSGWQLYSFELVRQNKRRGALSQDWASLSGTRGCLCCGWQHAWYCFVCPVLSCHGTKRNVVFQQLVFVSGSQLTARWVWQWNSVSNKCDLTGGIQFICACRWY